MVKYRNNLCFFTGILLLYALVKYSGLRYSLPGPVAYHLTDVLFIPLQLLICLWGLRILKKNKRLMIPANLIILVVGLMSILFECYLPAKGIGTGDFIDVWMYIAGGIGFYFIQRIL